MAEVGLTPSPRTLLPSNVAPWRGLLQAPALARPRKATLLYSGSRPVTESDPSPPLRHLPRHCPSRPRSRGSPSASRPQTLRAHVVHVHPVPLLSGEGQLQGVLPTPPAWWMPATPSRPTGMARGGPARRTAASEAGSCPGHPLPCLPRGGPPETVSDDKSSPHVHSSLTAPLRAASSPWSVPRIPEAPPAKGGFLLSLPTFTRKRPGKPKDLC